MSYLEKQRPGKIQLFEPKDGAEGAREEDAFVSSKCDEAFAEDGDVFHQRRAHKAFRLTLGSVSIALNKRVCSTGSGFSATIRRE
jgi:hypothetical protein